MVDRRFSWPKKCWIYDRGNGRVRFIAEWKRLPCVKVPRVHRHMMVGGSIYQGRLRIANYRSAKIFDYSRLHHRFMGCRAELMLARCRHGWQERHNPLDAQLEAVFAAHRI